jgi:hypothetical protein
MIRDPHLLVLAAATCGAGWLMAQAGLQKRALERKRRVRVCPSCGREFRAARCGC